MARKRIKKEELIKKKEELKETEEFWSFVKKVAEQTLIITDHNIQGGIDPTEEQIQLLKELHQMYDRSSLPYANLPSKEEQSATQSEINHDNVAE
jgi:hypothetical protein